MNQFRLEILAADRPFYDGPCESVTIPAGDGEMEFLAHHSTLVSAVAPGELRYRIPGQTTQPLAVGPGVIKVSDDYILVLVDSVERPEEIDANRALRKLEEAKEALRQKQSIQEYKTAQSNLANAVSRLKVKRKYQR